jgi:glucose-1-phosphatase
MSPSKSKTTIERTAIAEFRLGDRVVPVGTIVTLTPAQLDKLDAAGCVYKDDAKNADVPVADMPDTQGATDTDADKAAAEKADAEKAAAEKAAADKAEAERFGKSKS